MTSLRTGLSRPARNSGVRYMKRGRLFLASLYGVRTYFREQKRVNLKFNHLWRCSTVVVILFHSGPNPTECQKAYLEALRSYLPGRYIPSCTRSGKFEPIQVEASDAFCVDDKGREIPGTRVARPFKPTCVVGRFSIILLDCYGVQVLGQVFS